MTAGSIDLHWVQQPGSRIGRVVRPSSYVEAAEFLANEPDLRPLAGGTDLVLDLARDQSGGITSLLDLTAIDGYRSADFEDAAGITLGAGVTHAAILAAPIAVERVLPLAQACLEIGSPQLRNRATIVGNLVTASPANDTISALIALDASVRTIRIDDGSVVRRDIHLDDFYTGFRSTALLPHELIEQIVIPQPPAGRRGIWVKLGLRKAQAISVVHAGLVLDFDNDAVVQAARIALGSVGPIVELCDAAAQALVGQVLSPTTIAGAATAAAESVHPIDDGRATAQYRTDAVYTVVSRALTTLSQERERDQWPAKVPLLSASPGSTNRPASNLVVDAGDELAVTVNGSVVSAVGGHSWTLLDWLRENAGPGTKEGCAEGECGACTVQLDGDAVMSCLVPAVQAAGAQVTTIEGLGSATEPSAMQQSFVDTFAVQCGYCIPGFVVAAQTLADELGQVPTRDEIELALSGNLCRCTGYYNIIDAVIAAVSGKAS